jgi:hypothetical protein
MDIDRFDALTRSLVTSRTRRAVVYVLGSLAFGGALTTVGLPDVAAAKLIGGSSCKKDAKCQTGKCLSSGKCSCSKGFPDCKQPANACKQADCNFKTKRCETTNRTGPCESDDNYCTRDVCQDGACTHPPDPALDGAICGSAVGQTCQDGKCQCPRHQEVCNGECRNLQTDEAHCGECGKTCTGGKTCQGGNCTCGSQQECNGVCGYRYCSESGGCILDNESQCCFHDECPPGDICCAAEGRPICHPGFNCNF